jgi:hypothetical protein
MKNSTERKLAWVDKVLEREDGKPTKVRRKFEDLKQTTAFTFGDRDDSRDQEGALSGATLELTRGDGGAVEAKVIEGKADGDALTRPSPRARARLAPAGGRQERRRFVGARQGPSGAGAGARHDQDLVPAAGEEASSSGGGGSGRGRGRGGFSRGGPSALQQIDWEGKATLDSASEDYEGTSCRVIKLELKGEGNARRAEFRRRRRPRVRSRQRRAVRDHGQGRAHRPLLFDSASVCPCTSKCTASSRSTASATASSRALSFKSESTMEGEVKLETSLSVEKE